MNVMSYYSYLFVFSKNIEKTDITRGELITLIELQKKDVVIHIDSIEDLKLSNGAITFDKIDEKFSDDFTHIMFQSQSALVFSNFEIDLKEIIRRSGYIHSCGKFLFLTKWGNLSIEFIESVVENFCKSENNWYNTIFYKESDNKISNRLSSLLIDDTRYHIKNSSFNMAEIDLNNKLRKLKEKLSLKNKNEHIFIFLEKNKINNNLLLSNLYEDRNLVDFGVCYLSEYKKENPIHEMDDLKEIKPFWAGIFTTPHRLMSAMLNLAKINEDSVILDPFSHTGTLAIEASNIGCKVIASDIMGTQGAKDNYDFLCKSYKNFNSILKKIIRHTKDNELTDKLKELIDDNIFLNNQGLPETKSDISVMISSYSERLYFYILRRYAMELKRGADIKDLKTFISNYIGKLSKKKPIPGYRLFGKQFKLFEKEYKKTGYPLITISSDNKNFFIDSYYKSNRIGYINKNVNNYPIFQKNDICNQSDDYGIKESSIDAVITDPPYGYGEDLSESQVREIYTSLIEKSIKWLKPNGYMVFCALDKVKTGRTENLLFTEKILDIVNIIAKQNNVKFVFNNVLLTSNYLKNVYYWKSKYALNRSIISLQINKN